MASLRRRSSLRGLWQVLHAWGVIALAMVAFVLWPNPLSGLVAILVIGSRQLGLLILMHDAAHNALAASPWLNRLLGQCLCAWPMLADLHVYRRYHLRHHARTQQPGDPDAVLTDHYPISRASLRRKLLRDISGRSGLAQRREQFRQALAGEDLAGRLRHFAHALGPQLAFNAGLFGLLAALGHGYLYLLLWLLPMLTWQQLVLRVRNIAEHAIIPDRDDPLRNTRTTMANWLERMLVAPYQVNYHGEHHLAMWVPCYRLPAMRRMLAARGITARMETQPSYRAVLALAASRPEGSGGGSGDGPRRRALGTFSGGYDAA